MGVMQTDTIITTLLAAAAFLKEPVRALASQSLRDIYESTKYYLRRKFGAQSPAAVALEAATDNPTSPGRKLTLLEESATAKLEADPDLLRLIQTLAALLGGLGVTVPAAIHVSGNAGPVNVAGRDLIQTTRHITRNAVTPDKSHLSGEQCAEIRTVIAEVADRLADDSGAPNFAAVHRQLQRRFNVASYLLIPRERFPDALAFLKQRRATHRSRLRRRNPAAYASDLFRVIHACARQLGWDRDHLCAFAQERLGLREPVASLRELGSTQLRGLAEAMRRQANQQSAK